MQKEGKLKERRSKDRMVLWEEMVENERKEKEKQNRPKHRSVTWQEMVENERKEKEKEKERDGRPTRGCRPRHPALRPTGRPARRRFARSRGEILGTMVPQRCFSTPLFHSLLSVGLPVVHILGGLVRRMKTPALMTDGI